MLESKKTKEKVQTSNENTYLSRENKAERYIEGVGENDRD